MSGNEPEAAGTSAARSSKGLLSEDSVKALVPGYVLGGISFVVCLVVAASHERQPAILLLLCLLCGAVGWGLGLLFSSTSLSAQSEAKKIGQWIASAVSGLSLGNIDALRRTDAVAGIFPEAQDQILAVLLAAISLVIGILMTAVWCRRKIRVLKADQHSETISEIRELLEKLS